jgi:isopenicillin N synthase-like dioxygenase
MLDTPSAQVPTLSLADEARDPAAFAAAFGGSFERFGFAIVADHGIPLGLIERAWRLTEQFFALPVDEKRGYYDPALGGQRGYTPFKTEIAKDAKHVDLKEFWHVGRDLPGGHRFRDHMPDNLWPSEVPDFKNTFTELFATFDMAGLKVLKAIARYLKIDENYFEDAVRDGNSVLRALHYPPQSEPTGEHIRAGAHEDINAITLLLGAEEAGLELQTKDGRWIPVSPKPGELVINIGDMLQRLTNGKLRSTTHRVVNPTPDRASKARYSMPFFLHFRSDFLIDPLKETVAVGEQPKWPPITANDYLQERLREIKLV